MYACWSGLIDQFWNAEPVCLYAEICKEAQPGGWQGVRVDGDCMPVWATAILCVWREGSGSGWDISGKHNEGCSQCEFRTVLCSPSMPVDLSAILANRWTLQLCSSSAVADRVKCYRAQIYPSSRGM